MVKKYKIAIKSQDSLIALIKGRKMIDTTLEEIVCLKNWGGRYDVKEQRHLFRNLCLFFV